MVRLKNQFAKINETLKNILMVTSTSSADQVIPRIMKLDKNYKYFLHKIHLAKTKTENVKFQKKYADSRLESLQHNLTDEIAQRPAKMKLLRQDISHEKKIQEILSDEKKRNGEIVRTVKHALEHFCDALECVVELAPEVTLLEVEPSYLKLPLLKLPGRVEPLRKPVQIETDVWKLMGICNGKIKKLMDIFEVEPEALENLQALKMFQKDLLARNEKIMARKSEKHSIAIRKAKQINSL